MVQMPVDPSRNWKIMTGVKGLQSWKMKMIDFSAEKEFDEDLTKCMLRWTLKSGGVLKIRREGEDMIAQIDQMIIKGTVHNLFIEKLIKPLMEKLEDTVFNRSNVDPNGIHAVTSYSGWNSGLPGVTKIKIKFKWNSIRYTLNHKMGRNGGKNYHYAGGFYELDKPKE